MIRLLVLRLRNSSHLLKNSFWNLLGQFLPLLAALICIPILINVLGNEKFGFLSIAWMIIGYFSLFDFGLGRAVTHAVAKKNAEGKDASVIIITALKFLIFIGGAIGGIFYFLSGYIVSDLLNISDAILQDAESAIELLSYGLPFVIFTIGIRGVLEANQAFKQISFVSIPSGLLLFIAPTVFSYISDDLSFVFLSLVLVRVFQCLSFLFIMLKYVEVDKSVSFCNKELKHLLVFGSWMTVTNIVSPIMVSMDRFFIGAKLSVSAVTNYVVPFDMITKVLILPSAISGVLFPEFAKLIAEGRGLVAKSILIKWSFILSGLLSLPLIFIFMFSNTILFYWISKEFADASSLILQVLCIGVLINGVAYIPFAYIQGAGRSDLTAKIHLFEVMFYVPLLLVFIDFYGILGAATAWCIRVLVDFVLLFYFAYFRVIYK